MMTFNTTKIVASAIAFSAILFTQTVFAQKYRTAADTVKLNKAYGEVTLDIAKLNSDLIEEQNKTPQFEAKSASTAQNAVTSAEYSKHTASMATNGNLDDAKIAMKQARKANNEAKDAKNAKNDQENNLKKIDKINEKISEKQAELTDLKGQKADIISRLPASTHESM